jgi:hypothetical protein
MSNRLERGVWIDGVKIANFVGGDPFVEKGICSRCHKEIDNFSPPTGGMTAGYYVAAGWAKYANDGEVYICDDCMFHDPRYIADYGTVFEDGGVVVPDITIVAESGVSNEDIADAILRQVGLL